MKPRVLINDIISARTIGGGLGIPKSVNPVVIRELVERTLLDLMVNSNFILGQFRQELDGKSQKMLLEAGEIIGKVIETRYQSPKEAKKHDK